MEVLQRQTLSFAGSISQTKSQSWAIAKAADPHNKKRRHHFFRMVSSVFHFGSLMVLLLHTSGTQIRKFTCATCASLSSFSIYLGRIRGVFFAR